jgi:hypothetical protein
LLMLTLKLTQRLTAHFYTFADAHAYAKAKLQWGRAIRTFAHYQIIYTYACTCQHACPTCHRPSQIRMHQHMSVGTCICGCACVSARARTHMHMLTWDYTCEKVQIKHANSISVSSTAGFHSFRCLEALAQALCQVRRSSDLACEQNACEPEREEEGRAGEGRRKYDESAGQAGTGMPGGRVRES